MKAKKLIFKIIVYACSICLILVFLILVDIWLYPPKQFDFNKPTILVSADEMTELSNEDIVNKLFAMRLQSYSSFQDYKVTNVEKCNKPNSFNVKYLIKPYPSNYTYWEAGKSIYYEDGWLGKSNEVKLIKEDNQYQIEIILP